MTEPFRLRILHLSDLHARVALDWMSNERKRLIRSQKAMRVRVLGESLDSVLKEIVAEAPVDLVCFTGDIADWGLEEEYDQAGALLQKLQTLLNLEPGRLFLVPGNHDVNRKTEEGAWNGLRKMLAEREDVGAALGKWAVGAGVPAGVDPALLDGVLKRMDLYWKWIKDKQNRPDLVPGATDANHPTLGFRVTLKPDGLPFPVHVLGLNSGWFCGDDHDKGKVIVTREQVDWLCLDPNGDPLKGFRLALMHHPLGDLADWDSAEVRRTLADNVDLLLHGHQHDPNFEARIDPDRALRIVAAGSMYEGDKGDRFFNSFHVIDVWLDEQAANARYDVTFYGWSNRGFWHRTDAVYRISRNGKLSWSGPNSLPGPPGPPQISAETLRNAWHPPAELKRSGVLTPCQFTININYQSDGEARWKKYGDVLVSIDHPPTPDWTYLLPSRNAPTRFREPKKLRSDHNIGPKKRLIEKFVQSVGTRRLDGFWFYRTMAADNLQHVHVYAKELDDFLNNNATAGRTLVYISYKTIDNQWRLRLREILDRDERIEVWDDSKLTAGSDFSEVMTETVRRTRIMIVLASAEYLLAPLPLKLELIPALAAADAKELIVLWVPVREFDWKSSSLGRFMAPVDPNVSLESMTDAAWAAALYALYTAVCKNLNLKPLTKPQESFQQRLTKAKLV